MSEHIKSSVVDGVAELVLARPEALNALSLGMTDKMAELLAQWASDPAVRVVLLHGEGKHFAAGADVREMLDISARQAIDEDFAGCCAPLGSFPKPVIVAVQGMALGGGCELVEMCDIVLASEDAAFGHPELRLGTMPGAGGTQRLPRLVGMSVALDMLLGGRRLSAAEAERAGLVSRVVPRDDLLPQARALAAEIAAQPAQTARLIKEAARAAMSTPMADGLAMERRSFHLTLALPDAREGMRAFVEKRRPNFGADSGA